MVTDPLQIYEGSVAWIYADLKTLFPGVELWWMDGRYRWLSIGDWVKVLNQIKVNEIPYAADQWDCDDFAWIMRGLMAFRYRVNGIGMVLGESPEGPHAWNIFLAGPSSPEPGGRAWFMIEPQTYGIAPIPPGLPGYIAKHIVF